MLSETLGAVILLTRIAFSRAIRTGVSVSGHAYLPRVWGPQSFSFSFLPLRIIHQHHQTRPTIIANMIPKPNHGPSIMGRLPSW